MHRWIGVCLSLMFALWFATGAVLLFVPFPSLAPDERLAHLAPLDLDAIHTLPDAAIAASGLAAAQHFRLIQGAGSPIYIIADENKHAAAIDGKTGLLMGGISATDAGKVASLFQSLPPQEIVGPFAYDQWVVHQQFDALRPFYRVDFADPKGTELYVSARTSDVVQKTTRAQREWNYVGAVIHWIYPTIIRRSFAIWDNLVWVVSLVGVCLALSGLTLGIARTSRSMKRQARPAFSPYRGLFRLHHVAGLGAGIFLLSWIFSGWLSMDHGRIFSTGEPTHQQLASYRGMSIGQAARLVSREDLARFAGAKEISLLPIDGHALLAGRVDGSTQDEIEDLSAPAQPMMRRVPEGLVLSAVQAAWPAASVVAVRPVSKNDPYEDLVTEPSTDRLTRVILADSASSWLEIDTSTGQIKSVLDRSRRLYRWIYYGMHTFDLPFLSSHDILRKAIILTLLTCGEALSLTGLFLGAKKLRRTFLRRRPLSAISLSKPYAGPLL